jgi:hypothetical protein
MERDAEPIKVEAIVAFNQQTVANVAAQDQRNHATKNSIKNATWWAFGAVAAYAVRLGLDRRRKHESPDALPGLRNWVLNTACEAVLE